MGQLATRIYSKEALLTQSTNCSPLEGDYSPTELMMLSPLATTISPKQRPKPYSFGRPTNNQEPLEATDTLTSSNKTLPPAVCSSQLEEQIQFLNKQLNQLKSFSENSLQQTTPAIQKFPLAHRKQVQYLQVIHLTVAQLHQDIKSEKLERQILQLMVFQHQKYTLSIQTFLANLNTGASQEPFTFDPPSAGTITSPLSLETHELLKTPAPRHILNGNSDSPSSCALSSLSDQRPLSPEPMLKAPMGILVDQLDELFNEEVSRKKSLLSGLQSNFSSLYNKIRQLVSGNSNTIPWRISSAKFIYTSAKSAYRASKPIGDKSSGYWGPIFRTHIYGYIFKIQL